MPHDEYLVDFSARRQCYGAKRKRESGRRGGPGSLRRRKDVLSVHIVTYGSRGEKGAAVFYLHVIIEII